MPQTTVTFRMDENLKRNMERTCQELGMSMTTAFTIFAKKMSRENRIPFEVSADPFFSESNLSHLHTSLAQLSEGKTVEKTMEELEAMANE